MVVSSSGLPSQCDIINSVIQLRSVARPSREIAWVNGRDFAAQAGSRRIAETQRPYAQGHIATDGLHQILVRRTRIV